MHRIKILSKKFKYSRCNFAIVQIFFVFTKNSFHCCTYFLNFVVSFSENEREKTWLLIFFKNSSLISVFYRRFICSNFPNISLLAYIKIIYSDFPNVHRRFCCLNFKNISLNLLDLVVQIFYVFVFAKQTWFLRFQHIGDSICQTEFYVLFCRLFCAVYSHLRI